MKIRIHSLRTRVKIIIHRLQKKSHQCADTFRVENVVMESQEKQLFRTRPVNLIIQKLAKNLIITATNREDARTENAKKVSTYECADNS